MPGRSAEAITEFEAALRSHPNLMGAHVNPANLLAKTRAGSPTPIAEYKAALRISPDPVVRQMTERLKAEQRAATPAR